VTGAVASNAMPAVPGLLSGGNGSWGRRNSKSESKASDDCSMSSDISTHASDQAQAASSPRPSSSSDTAQGVKMALEQTMLASPTTPKRESWCDVLDDVEDDDNTDEEFQKALGSASLPMSPSSRAQRRSERRRKRREMNRAARAAREGQMPAVAAVEAAGEKKLPSGEQLSVVRGGPVQGGVVTLADIGFPCGSGMPANSPTSPPKARQASQRQEAPQSPSWQGIMSTAPERPTRPAPVMLPQGSVSSVGYMSCVSPTGDSSMTTVTTVPYNSPTSGDASTRTVWPGSPMAGPTGAVYSCPDYWYGTDASARSTEQCQYPTWAVEASCHSPQLVHQSIVDTSPQLSPSHWSPQGDALQAILCHSPLANGMDLAAALKAAAPETYDD